MAKRILIVDDDPDFLDMTRLTLEAAGYAVTGAESAADAETMLESLRPDLVIFDLMLEDMDSGFVLSHRTKVRYPGLPIIMISGVAAETGMAFDATTSEERSWLRADSFLDKPVRPEQIVQEVRRLLADE